MGAGDSASSSSIGIAGGGGGPGDADADEENPMGGGGGINPMGGGGGRIADNGGGSVEWESCIERCVTAGPGSGGGGGTTFENGRDIPDWVKSSMVGDIGAGANGGGVPRDCPSSGDMPVFERVSDRFKSPPDMPASDNEEWVFMLLITVGAGGGCNWEEAVRNESVWDASVPDLL